MITKVKYLVKFILFITICLLAVELLASSAPPDPGGDPSTGGPPVGGGAPVGNGTYILISFGLTYIIYKVMLATRKTTETTQNEF